MTNQTPIRVPRRAGGMPYADIPPISDADAKEEPQNGRIFPDDEQRPTITISTTIQHRGRIITISANNMTADQFCDLLDRRGFAPPERPQRWQTLPDGTPICPKHHTPMRLREKQGDSWYSHRVTVDGQELWCKGYHGKDSPGYDH